jgi:hypothetical protein
MPPHIEGEAKETSKTTFTHTATHKIIPDSSPHSQPPLHSLPFRPSPPRHGSLIAVIFPILLNLSLSLFAAKMQNAGHEDSANNPFRLMDLPLELRKRIYAFCLFKPRGERSCRAYFDALTDRPLFIDTLYSGPERGGPLTPAILRAGNRQLRAEAGEVYYNKGHDIYLGFQGESPFIELAKWRYMVVGNLAVHLPDLRLHISRSSPGDEIEHEYIIHIKLSPNGNGITAEGFWGVVNEDRRRRRLLGRRCVRPSEGPSAPDCPRLSCRGV